MAGPSSTPDEKWTYIPTDLSNYYIIRKFRHGWLMKNQNSEETIFIPRERLVKMGYISDEGIVPSKKIQEYPHVIVVPIGRLHRRSSSEDERSGDSKPIDIPRPPPKKDNLRNSMSRSYPEEEMFYSNKT